MVPTNAMLMHFAPILREGITALARHLTLEMAEAAE